MHFAILCDDEDLGENSIRDLSSSLFNLDLSTTAVRTYTLFWSLHCLDESSIVAVIQELEPEIGHVHFPKMNINPSTSIVKVMGILRGQTKQQDPR